MLPPRVTEQSAEALQRQIDGMDMVIYALVAQDAAKRAGVPCEPRPVILEEE